MTLHREFAKVCVLFLGLLSLMLFGSAPDAFAQSSELTSLASESAAAINRKFKDANDGAEVFVEDFSDAQLSESGLGSKLADQFESELKKNAIAFIVLDRAEYRRLSAEEDRRNDCHSPVPKSKLSIEGRYQSYPGNVITLRIEVLDDGRSLFAKIITLDLTPELVSLLSPPEPEPEPESLRGKVVWMNKNRSHNANANPVRMSKKPKPGYSRPACLRCPNPQYPDAAVKSRMEGTVYFDVEIDAKGRPAVIAVVKGLPCGLTQQAVEAVAHWRFKPATGPDGKPVSVITEAEVTFRLY